MTPKLSDQRIKALFGRPNMLTRDFVERGQIGEFIFELSYGNGITGTGLWGLTIRDLRGKEIKEYPSKSFYSEASAEHYLNTLRLKQLITSP